MSNFFPVFELENNKYAILDDDLLCAKYEEAYAKGFLISFMNPFLPFNYRGKVEELSGEYSGLFINIDYNGTKALACLFDGPELRKSEKPKEISSKLAKVLQQGIIHTDMNNSEIMVGIGVDEPTSSPYVFFKTGEKESFLTPEVARNLSQEFYFGARDAEYEKQIKGIENDDEVGIEINGLFIPYKQAYVISIDLFNAAISAEMDYFYYTAMSEVFTDLDESEISNFIASLRQARLDYFNTLHEKEKTTSEIEQTPKTEFEQALDKAYSNSEISEATSVTKKAPKAKTNGAKTPKTNKPRSPIKSSKK